MKRTTPKSTTVSRVMNANQILANLKKKIKRWSAVPLSAKTEPKKRATTRTARGARAGTNASWITPPNRRASAPPSPKTRTGPNRTLQNAKAPLPIAPRRRRSVSRTVGWTTARQIAVASHAASGTPATTCRRCSVSRRTSWSTISSSPRWRRLRSTGSRTAPPSISSAQDATRKRDRRTISVTRSSRKRRRRCRSASSTSFRT